jgi:hypothetical protein
MMDRIARLLSCFTFLESYNTRVSVWQSLYTEPSFQRPSSDHRHRMDPADCWLIHKRRRRAEKFFSIESLNSFLPLRKFQTSSALAMGKQSQIITFRWPI